MGCPVIIRYLIDEESIWKVQNFVDDHNHEVATLDDQHLLRSWKSITDEKAIILKIMTYARIRTVDAFVYLVEEVSGIENVGFSKRDIYNYIQNKNSLKIENGDTSTLIQLFKER